MTVRCEDDVVFLEGACPVEDAESLLVLFQQQPDRQIDLSQCVRAHSAVVQVLLVAQPRLHGTGAKGFVQQWIVPLIDGSRG
jgi:hypothetical protein